MTPPLPLKLPTLSAAAKILIPAALVFGLGLYHKLSVRGAFEKGVESRQILINDLTGERDLALADIEILTGDLNRARTSLAQASAKIDSLNSRIIAQADENSEALRKQAEQFAAAQSVTSNAMQTLARNHNSADVDFAAILEQFKGVTYDYDQTRNRCIIRGGGRLLRDAARGKAGQ